MNTTTQPEPLKVCLRDQLGLAASRPVVWMRKHPDGTLTGEMLTDARIEALRTTSGAWEPLYTNKAAAQALEHATSVLKHNEELLVERDRLRAWVEEAVNYVGCETWSPSLKEEGERLLGLKA